MAGGPCWWWRGSQSSHEGTQLGLGSQCVPTVRLPHTNFGSDLSAPTLGLGTPAKIFPKAEGGGVLICLSKDPGVHALTGMDQEPIVSCTFLLLFDLNRRAA